MLNSDHKKSFRKYLIEVGLKIKDPAFIDYVDGNTKGIHRYMLIGKVGTGKTELARRLCKYSGQRFIRLEARNFANITQSDVYGMIKDQDIIVIDDIGTETSDVIQKTEMVLNTITRAFEQYSSIGLIITSNLDNVKLGNFYGDRVFDRLVGWLTIFETNPPSFRKQNAKVVK